MSHWRKLDHLAFLMMLIPILIIIFAPFAFRLQLEIVLAFVVSGVILLSLWIVALVYDLFEEQQLNEEKKA
jgi:hypothetical protein